MFYENSFWNCAPKCIVFSGDRGKVMGFILWPRSAFSVYFCLTSRAIAQFTIIEIARTLPRENYSISSFMH